MSNIAFIGTPAHGHVNPTLAVAQELVQRKEHITYYNSDEFQIHIETTGAAFHPYPTGALPSSQIADACQSANLASIMAVYLRATKILVPFLIKEFLIRRPDIIIADSHALWGHIAARLLNIPTVSTITSIVSSSAQLRLTLREWFRVLIPALSKIPETILLLTSVMHRFGASTLPRLPLFPARGDLSLSFIPPDFQPDNFLVDTTFRFVGPSINPTLSIQDNSIDLSNAETVVYISLGSLLSGTSDFYRQCFKAFADAPVRCVMSLGTQTSIASLGPVPANFIVRQSIPQVDVLQHADVFISHGGMNSVLESLYFGVPLILIPPQIEQLITALHVSAQGAGIMLRGSMSGTCISASELRGAFERIIAEPGFRTSASQIKNALRSSGGYMQAADEIQTSAHRFRPIRI